MQEFIMKKSPFFPCMLIALLALVALTGCSGLKRGMDGNVYVSSAKPPLTVAVPGLPLRTAGYLSPSITTGNSLGGITIDAWMAVYGGTTAQQPMAIVSQAEIPPMWFWDSDLYRTFSVDRGSAVLGGRLYQACTYIVNGADDAFSTLVAQVEPDKMRWIVRRFAARTEFDIGKITLEYREALPEGYDQLTNLPQGGVTFLRDFALRAEKAFVFEGVPANIANVRTGYVQGIRTRFLNNNFFGTMSYHDPMN